MKLEKYQTDLIVRIEKAFHGVPRGPMGLREAFAMDSLGKTMAEIGHAIDEARLRDVEQRWEEIDLTLFPPSDLKSLPLVFMDEQSIKFVLPALMTFELTHYDGWLGISRSIGDSIYYRLIPESRSADRPDVIAKKMQLTQPQIVVIVDWIEHYLVRYEIDLPALEAAQVDRWKALLTPSGT